MEIGIPFRVMAFDYLEGKTVSGWNTKRMSAYIDALKREIEANASEFTDCRVQAVRFGGGAASNAGTHIADLVKVIRSRFDMAGDVSITMQSSISNISGATMPLFRRADIQRFDFEMMSLDEVHYVAFNKVDNLKDLPIVCDHFLHSYRNDTLGYILAYGYVPSDQETEDEMVKIFRRSILQVARSHAAHLILCKAKDAPDSLVKRQYADANEVLGEAGFVEYLPDCWAREGKEDRFLQMNGGFGREAVLNTKVDKLAFGLGAETCFEGARSKNTFDLATYLQFSNDYTKITETVDAL